jgi:16S rRNA (guanine527-N7)-methyltransferase
MTSREFRDRLERSLGRASTPLPPTEQIAQLEGYFSLLTRWNAKINLTALPLTGPTDETFDRLMAEPLAAQRHSHAPKGMWYDLGSGGGSPAIPWKIVEPQRPLTMVESKSRKAAFLREAVRALQLEECSVQNSRFENLTTAALTVQLVTVRAVRPDETLIGTARHLLGPGGVLVLFQPSQAVARYSGFAHVKTTRLLRSKLSYAAVYHRVFHVEHSC